MNEYIIAIPTQPLNDVTLSDADETSALSYLQQNLKDLGMDRKFNSEEVQLLRRLGGRVRDLETVGKFSKTLYPEEVAYVIFRLYTSLAHSIMSPLVK